MSTKFDSSISLEDAKSLVETAEKQLAGDRGAVARRRLAAAQLTYGQALARQGEFGHMTNCLRAAVTTLTQLAQNDADDSDLGWQLAEAHQALGDGLAIRGDFSGAVRSFTKAINLLEHWHAARSPAVGQHKLATMQERLGEIQQMRGEFVLAAACYRLAYAHLEWLNAHQPQRKYWQRGMAIVLDRLAGLAAQRGQSDSALETLLRAQVIRRRALLNSPDDPQLKRELALSHERIGLHHLDTGHYNDALAAFEQSLAVREPLLTTDAGGDRQREIRREISVTRERLGDTHRALQHSDLALQNYQTCLRFREELAQAEPDRVQAQADLIVIRHKLGDYFASLDRWDGARLAYRAAHAQIIQRTVQEWTNPDRQSDLAVSHANLGKAAAALNEPLEALDHLRQAMHIRERLVQRDRSQVQFHRDLAITREQIARVLLNSGQPQMALKALTAAVDSLSSLPPDLLRTFEIRRDLTVLRFQLIRMAWQNREESLVLREHQFCRELLQGFSVQQIQSDPVLADVAARMSRSEGPSCKPGRDSDGAMEASNSGVS